MSTCQSSRCQCLRPRSEPQPPPASSGVPPIVAVKFNHSEDLQDGGGVRCGDQLPPHKYGRNTSTCGTTPTEHLLNTGRRPQTSQRQETPHVPGRVIERVLVFQLGVRPEPLRWESRVLDYQRPPGST